MTAIETVSQIQSQFAAISAPQSTNASSAALFAQLVASLNAVKSKDAAPATGATGQDIVDSAKKYLGVPYVFGGTDASGIDCSGLVQTACADVGVKTDRVVSDQEDDGVAVPSLADAKPGDLIVLNGGQHIVIYEGNGKVIHAPETGRNVQEAPVWFTDADIVTIRRVAPVAAAPTNAAVPAATSPTSALQALIAAQTASANSLQALIAAQSAMLAGSRS